MANSGFKLSKRQKLIECALLTGELCLPGGNGPLRRSRAHYWKWLERSMLDGSGVRAQPRSSQPQQVTEVRASDVSADEIRALSLKTDSLLVVRGFGDEMECVRTWTPKMFREKYGDIEITCPKVSMEADQSGFDFASDGNLIQKLEKISVRQLLEQAESPSVEPQPYVQFEAEIFKRHPELLGDFDGDKLYSIARPRNPLNNVLLTKMFMGGAGTGTNWHNAPMHNLFLQVYGEKEWLFCDSAWEHLLYKQSIWKATYNISPIQAFNPGVDAFPLYAHAPLFRTVLKPGDLLVLPHFWYHAVRNMGPSIGCSMWWMPLIDDLIKHPYWTALSIARVETLLNMFKTMVGGRRMPWDSVSVNRLYYNSELS